jgi:hypothetical protein
MKIKPNILVLHYTPGYITRPTLIEYMDSFKKYSGCKCYYLNLAYRRIPQYLTKIRFNLIVFSVLFFNARWDKEISNRIIEKTRIVKNMSGIKIAFPQDEFLDSDFLCKIINECNIQNIFSVSPESEWPKIYNGVDLSTKTVRRVLTGYIEESMISKINKKSSANKLRSIDIGYRAGSLAWAGKFCSLKQKLAEIFLEKASHKGLVLDISFNTKDFFTRNDWYDFLLKCKYTLGVEGGASLLDYDGSIRLKVAEYLRKYPEANLDDIERECFLGKDGNIDIKALSPRHFEACATKTCQILIKGDYNGILKPGKHYIELNEDFSNIEDVIRIVREDKLRGSIVETAYKDIIESGMYTYKRFIEYIMDTTGCKNISNNDFREEVFGYIVYFMFSIKESSIHFYLSSLDFLRPYLPNKLNKIYLKVRMELLKRT